ncbi:hypothetical protein FS749_000366 [Ceratobasidium sp. UAMH 11750]|nr:hypothetical protein FS749_000366 [Ceratobasidium sp. UAMH 11750]
MRTALLHEAVYHPKGSQYFYNSEPITSGAERPIDRQKLKSWFDNWNDLLEILGLLMHILGGQPTCQTELLNILVENTANNYRGLYYYHDRFFYLININKASNRDRLVVHGLPPELNELILVTNAVARPAAEAFTSILYGQEKAIEQRKWFFYASGKRTHGDQMTKRLRSVTEEYLRSPFGWGDWRHVLIMIARKYFHIEPGEEQVDGPEENNAWDYLASHTPKTAAEHYAIEPLEWSCFRDDTISKYIGMCNKVSTWYFDLDEQAVILGKRLLPA